MSMESAPLLSGSELFRAGEQAYINRSDESWQDYMNLLHRHDFIEIAYVISGAGLHQVGDKQYATRKGDLFIINHDVAHGFFPDADHPAPIVYNCVFLPAFLDAALLQSAQFDHATSSWLSRTLTPEAGATEADLRLTGTQYKEIGALFTQMHEEYKACQKGYMDVIRALLITLIIKIFRLLEATPADKSSHQHRALVEQAILYMREHYQSDLRLDEVAMQTFVSKNHFSRLFREVTGICFSEYVQKLRIDEAVNLLQTTDKKVTEIASECGFHDQKNFYVTFRKWTGTTPGSYRG